MVAYQLLRPTAYLTIEHPKKWIFDWGVPVLLSLFSLTIFVALGRTANYLGDNGLVTKIASFVQILPGFYIAALAAIATFNKTDIDQHMPEPSPKLDITIGNQTNKISLTRRRFLCMLFAFLTAESLAIAVLSIFSVTFCSSIASLFPQGIHYYLLFSFLFLYMLLFWQMLTATFLGLYYLGDRLHQPDQQ